MEILEEYENKTITRSDEGVPEYNVDPFKFTEKEENLLSTGDKLFTQMELESIKKEPDISLRRKVLQEYLRMKLPKTRNIDRLIDSIINKILGYGELSELINDGNLEEIMVNGVNLPVFVFHKKYGMCSTNISFDNREAIFRIINRLCWIHNIEETPVVDFSSIDGSRINITSDPIALHGPTLTIRKQKKSLMTITELIKNGTVNVDLASLLWLAVDGLKMAPANLLIAGMIGSGKTTLLNALVMLTPPEDRIITIEETAELQLHGKKNWVPLETQKGYDMEHLVRNTLRMRPNKIVIGEIRGSEAIALFNAMNVGHKGMGTLHSSSAREVVYRLESPPMNVPSKIVNNLDMIVIMNIFALEGHPVRRITEVAEIGGHEGDTILIGNIYTWDPKKESAGNISSVTASTYLDKLAEKIKLSKKDIVNELNRRKTFLQGLVNEDITEYDDVLAAVNEFYKRS